MATKCDMVISPRLQAKELARRDEVRPLLIFFSLVSRARHTRFDSRGLKCARTSNESLYFAFCFQLVLAKKGSTLAVGISTCTCYPHAMVLPGMTMVEEGERQARVGGCAPHDTNAAKTATDTDIHAILRLLQFLVLAPDEFEFEFDLICCVGERSLRA